MQKPTNIQTGRLIDENNRDYDITVILNFPTEADYESCRTINDFPSVNLIDFYFGDTNDQDTNTYVDLFIQKQSKLQALYQKLLALFAANPDDTELRDQIDFVKSLIVKLN